MCFINVTFLFKSLTEACFRLIHHSKMETNQELKSLSGMATVGDPKAEGGKGPHQKNATCQMVYLSVCLYMTFFCLGLIASLTAPSLLHLIELYIITNRTTYQDNVNDAIHAFIKVNAPV